MRTYNIPSSYRKSEILIMPADLALLSTLTGSNYPCLELICMVPKVFEPLKFDCIYDGTRTGSWVPVLLPSAHGPAAGCQFLYRKIFGTFYSVRAIKSFRKAS